VQADGGLPGAPIVGGFVQPSELGLKMPESFERKIRQVIDRAVGRTLGTTRLPAIVLTVAAPILSLGVLALIAFGELVWAGVCLAFTSLLDMLDGALARAQNDTSRRGAFLDSTLDRYCEALVFFGFMLYYHRVAPGSTELLLVYAACAGSLITSYARARAEGLGFDGKVGLLERPQRVLLLIVGLLTGWMTAVLWILAVLANVTALQRIVHVVRQGPGAAPPA